MNYWKKIVTLILVAMSLTLLLIACDAANIEQVADQAAELATQNADSINAMATQGVDMLTQNADTINNAATQVVGAVTENADTIDAAAATAAAMATAAAPTLNAVATDAMEMINGDFTPGTPLTDPNCAGTFSQIAATGQYEVTFDLCKPDPAFVSKIAFTSFSIYPEEYLNSTGGTGEILEKPVGTGPWALDTWNRGDSLILKRNDAYWGEKAVSDQLVFRWNSEAAARLLELQSGTVDGIDNPAPDDFETIAADSSLQLLERPALNIFYIGMSSNVAPFDNQEVRQALAMGLDRQRIVDNFYPAGSEVASHFTPCSIPNGCVGDAWYEFNAATAKEKLAAAGFPDGFETTLYYRDVVRGYLPEPGVVAQEIASQLETNLGIKVNIEVVESGTFLTEASAGNYSLYLLGWGADYPHPTNFLDYHFGKANPQFGAVYPEIYEKLEKAAQIANPAEAEGLYIEANNAIREVVPMIPVANGGSGTAYRADVVGGQASPLGNENFAVVTPGDRTTFVWMQNAEPISLFCADETDGESLRACEQIYESLYTYEVGGTAPIPALATNCEPNVELTKYVCTLREGVTFHDGSTFDANDVVASYSMGLDYTNPNHKGNSGVFEYYSYLWGLINAPAVEE